MSFVWSQPIRLGEIDKYVPQSLSEPLANTLVTQANLDEVNRRILDSNQQREIQDYSFDYAKRANEDMDNLARLLGYNSFAAANADRILNPTKFDEITYRNNSDQSKGINVSVGRSTNKTFNGNTQNSAKQENVAQNLGLPIYETEEEVQNAIHNDLDKLYDVYVTPFGGKKIFQKREIVEKSLEGMPDEQKKAILANYDNAINKLLNQNKEYSQNNAPDNLEGSYSRNWTSSYNEDPSLYTSEFIKSSVGYKKGSMKDISPKANQAITYFDPQLNQEVTKVPEIFNDRDKYRTRSYKEQYNSIKEELRYINRLRDGDKNTAEYKLSQDVMRETAKNLQQTKTDIFDSLEYDRPKDDPFNIKNRLKDIFSNVSNHDVKQTNIRQLGLTYLAKEIYSNESILELIHSDDNAKDLIVSILEDPLGWGTTTNANSKFKNVAGDIKPILKKFASVVKYASENYKNLPQNYSSMKFAKTSYRDSNGKLKFKTSYNISADIMTQLELINNGLLNYYRNN